MRRALRSFCLLTVLCVTYIPTQYCSAGESLISRSAGGQVLSTRDGLTLTLSESDGAVLSVGAMGPRFRARRFWPVDFEEALPNPAAPELLTGPGGAASWTSESAAAFVVRGSDASKPERTVTLNQSEPQPLVLTGSCSYTVKSDAVGWMNAGLAVNAYPVYRGGLAMPEQSAYFGQYDHGPQTNRRIICPDRPIEHLKVVLNAADPGGTANFSNVSLKQGIWRRFSPSQKLERLDDTIVQKFEDQSTGLRGTLVWEPMEQAVRVRCSFESTLDEDRAVSATLRMPVDCVGGTWYDDGRTSRKIQAGQVYHNSSWYGAGRDGFVSRYPFGCVVDRDGRGLALGVDVWEPRVFQISYDAGGREFRVRFDIGLARESGRWANRGGFTAYLFTFNAADGFRGAAEKFYSIFPEAYRGRAKAAGVWMAFLSPSTIPGGWKDFGFQFVESIGNMGFDERNGLSSMRYIEPWIHHQSDPPAADLKELVEAAATPASALEFGRKVSKLESAAIAPEVPAASLNYLSGYITDNWGEPQGYLFRRQGGRNENMMIQNPNPLVYPAGDGSQWDRVTQGRLDTRQWVIPGWWIERVGDKPGVEIEASGAGEGKNCLRLDPVRSRNYYEQYLRAVHQTVYCSEKGPYELSLLARAEGLPEGGTSLGWRVNVQDSDEKDHSQQFRMEGLGGEWQRFRFDVPLDVESAAVTVSLYGGPFSADPSTVWIDDVRLTHKGKSRNLIANGGFERAELATARLDGIYMDTMECYLNNLNYRREQWQFADEPPTFDSARNPALQQQFSHVTLARHAAEWARARDMFVFGNCAPATPFGAPWLDVMGGEVFWMQGDKFAPPSDGDHLFATFMCNQKPYCLLQYSDMDRRQIEQYVMRCVLYGIWPGNQSTSGKSGRWYWGNPLRVQRDRATYRKWIPVLKRITSAGWQPVTLASSGRSDVWVERFGEGQELFLTVYNSTATRQDVVVTVDERAGDVRSVRDIQSGKAIGWDSGKRQFSLKLNALTVAALRLSTQ